MNGIEVHSEAADTQSRAPWAELHKAAAKACQADTLLHRYFDRTILRWRSLSDALAGLLARKLSDELLGTEPLEDLAREILAIPGIAAAAAADLAAASDRDPAAGGLLTPFLHYKGFHALQAHRAAHWLWHDGRRDLARILQARVSERFGIDIHPAVPVGRGVFIDHGSGVVVGETAVIGNAVSILQEVTLGGTGKEGGDRHPKIRDGVLLGAGAKVLGNIEVGRGAKVGAGSVVLRPVPPCATVAGVPARIVGWCKDTIPGLDMDHELPD